MSKPTKLNDDGNPIGTEPIRLIRRISMSRLQQMDPMAFVRLVWPHISLYDKQREIMYSVRDNYQTFVPAGNMLGKDFISGLTVLWFFCTRRPCRIGTTSAQFEQLNDILWGEIRWLIGEAKVNLPIRQISMKLQQIRNDKTIVEKSEVVGKVVKTGEAFLGRHPGLKDIPRTLLVIDECSGVDDETYDKASTWADRILCVGNCYPCTNFWFKEVKNGDQKMDDGSYYRKVITISADDSPNVKYARAEIANGKKPSNKILIPGVITWREYEMREKYWPEEKKCVSLHGKFYEGASVKLFPETWLKHSWKLWEEQNEQRKNTTAKGMGVDTAEGGDDSCWCVAGDTRLLELHSESTPDTSVIPTRTIEFIKRYNLDPEDVYFDQGGGGKEHVDFLRRYRVRCKTLFFGGAATQDRTFEPEWISPEDKRDYLESGFAYKNRRAELYHKASQKVNPAYGGFALPPESEGPQYAELYRQLRAMAKLTDREGKYYLPPKKAMPNSTEDSLEKILGCSPDEADSFVLAIWAIEQKENVLVLGAKGA